ncbi:MAG: fibronectin type III domain-containing protein, partial [Bacteroidales bacterium]
MRKILIFIIFLYSGLLGFAQSYNMPTTGYMEIHSDSGSIYDDGGSSNNYSNRVNSSLTLYPATPGKFIRIHGKYFLEDYHRSRVSFYDGDTSSTILINTIYNDGVICAKSRTGAITLKFNTDTETPKQGFSFNFFVSNDYPSNANVFNITDTTAEINWTVFNDTSHWVFVLSDGRIFNLDTNYIKLDTLDPCNPYSFTIYSQIDSQVIECSYCNSYGFVTTGLKYNKPYNFNINKDCKSIALDWSEKLTNTIWKAIIDNDTIVLDSSYVKFDSLKSGTYYNIAICPLVVENESCECEKLYINTDCCCPIAQNINVSNITSNSAILTWDTSNDTNSWILKYAVDDIQYGINNDSIITFLTDTNYVELNNLNPVRPYIVYIYSVCDTFSIYCQNTVEFFTSLTAEECIEFTNLNSSNFIPQFGSYSNPYLHNGLIDYNYLSPYSRHTIHYDTKQKDERTNNLLSTVPNGELASFRLGNWLPGAEAESCTFAYYVDTNNFDMFLLKYAIVLEDPNHNQAQQPRFTLEIMDTNYVLFDEECGYTDFYASGDLNWNTVEGSTVIWKDWTSIGIDLSSYHNQKIFVRFTTYDCDEGGHFGYAYFNLKCDNRYTNKEFCGENDTLIFEAPLGFDYLWYNINNPEDTLSTSRELSVLVNNNTYICKCSNKENSNCNFNLTFIAEKRYPFPQFDNIEDTCGYKVYFYNKSIISSNDSIGIGDEKCLDIKWIFHDGSISFEQNPVFTYDSSGVYPVILIAKINDGICVDTLYKNIHIDISGIKTIIFSGDTIICRGSEVKISVNEFDSYLWINNDTTKTIIVSPLETTKYFIQVSDNGCIRYDSITIYVEPYYYMDTLFGVICSGASYNQNDFN